MEFLLKIVEGPMKGAEIALVAGSRVTLGSGEACDIVIADRTLPSVACELDVSESSVTRIGDGGEAMELAPFVVVSFGTTAIAVGPAEGVWEELKRPEPAKAESEGTVPDAPRVAGADAVSEEEEVDDRRPRGEGASGTTPPGSRRGGLVAAAIVLLVLIVVIVLAWLFWPQAKSWCDSRLTRRAAASTAPAPAPAPTLADLATAHGLVLTNHPLSSVRHPLLKGNLKRRTERLAIRALALAADPTVRFDLTDDETLCASANELLFVVTEGQLTATSASNRVVTLAGYSPNAAALERAVRAISVDVPGVERLVTKAVQVGGVPPKKPDADAVAASETSRPAGVVRKRPAAPDYPIAGILTKPYPCVVMRGGLRLTEGAQIGSVVIERIEVDKLTLRDGQTTVVWTP